MHLHLKNNIFTAFLILCYTYRLFFLTELVHFPMIKPYSAFTSLMLGLIDDLSLATMLVLIIFLLQISSNFLLRNHPSLSQTIKQLSKIILLSIFVGFICLFLSNKKLFFTLFTGFTLNLLKNGWQAGFKLSDGVLFLNLADGIFIVFAITIYFLLVYRLPEKISLWIMRVVITIVLVTLSFALYGLSRENYNAAYIKILYRNPITYLLADLANPSSNYYTNKLDRPSQLQARQLGFIDPIFIKKPVLLTQPVSSQQKPWNVVVIILESVGSPYVFSAASSSTVPMPFLKKLASRSLWLNNNYTSGNTSILGGFGLLTGLYPSARPDNFVMQPQIQIPTFSRWLNPKYDTIFTMVGDLNYFFQRGLIANTGFKKIDDFNTIPSTQKNVTEDKSVNEVDAVNFFLHQLKQAKPPFFAVYWTNANHKPYYDFGNAYHLLPNIKDPYVRYINNLYLIDTQLKRIYDLLYQNKHLAHTVLVVVGDHGEGFGQHPDEWMHGATLYQEQIKVPVLFYQPQLFKPKIINAVTSSVDILPTLFEAIAIPYNPNLIQGESLLHPTNRKYVFVYGNEYELVSISQSQIKKQISFREGGCLSYDLNQDPRELHPLMCVHDAQESAMLQFHNYQPDILHRYNSLLLQPHHNQHWLQTLKKI